MKTIDPNKQVDLIKDYAPNGLVTGLWNIGFRTIGDYPQPRMNWFGSAYGDTLKDAIINARHAASAASKYSKRCDFSWSSPVTVVYYCGRFNLMTMDFEPGDEHKQIKVFDEGITNMI